MIQAVHKHPHHFSFLALLLSMCFVAFIYFNHSEMMQRLAIWGMVIGYFGWGIIHHLIRRDLSGFIVLEYLMISVLAGVVLQAVVLLR